MQKTVSIETMIILDDLIQFMEKFDTFYKDDHIWKKLSRKIRKYKPFLKYDKDKMKQILKNKMTK